MDKVKQTDNKCFEDSEAFIKRLSDNSDKVSESNYDYEIKSLNFS